MPHFGEMEQVVSGRLVDDSVHLHDLPNGEVLVAVLHHEAENIRLPLVDLFNLPDNGFRGILLGLLRLEVPQQIDQRFIDARDAVVDEVRQIHRIVFGIQIGEGIFRFRPQDNPGDCHIFEQPVAPRENVPVEDATSRSSIAVRERVDIPDEIVQDDALDDRMSQLPPAKAGGLERQSID